MLIFCGDYHGDFSKIINEIKRLDLKDCSIFQVGDFGIGFNTKKKEIRALRFLNITLKARNIKLYAIRGNHDDPIYFNGDVYENITLLKDYTVINIKGLNILCVGGAISIDRNANPDIVGIYGRPHKSRKAGVNYWVDEAFVLKPELLNNLKNIDIVVTHSCPSFCEPITKQGLSSWIKHDANLIDDCTKERNDHSALYNILKANNNPLKYWLYGHYHFHNNELIDNTKFVLLDINEFFEIRI